MVYVEYQIDGTIREQIRNETRRDGRDKVGESVVMTDERSFELYYEFPTGHVNLEGYCPSRVPDTVAENVEAEINRSYGGNGEIETDTRTLETTVAGGEDEWIKQARRWISERPDHTVESALEYFASFCEVSGASKPLGSYPLATLENMEPFTPERHDYR